MGTLKELPDFPPYGEHGSGVAETGAIRERQVEWCVEAIRTLNDNLQMLIGVRVEDQVLAAIAKDIERHGAIAWALAWKVRADIRRDKR